MRGAPAGRDAARALARVMTSMTTKGGTTPPIPTFSKGRKNFFFEKKKQKTFA
jgi:hypothetical protein